MFQGLVFIQALHLDHCFTTFLVQYHQTLYKGSLILQTPTTILYQLKHHLGTACSIKVE
jgi:hypothetical protein